MTLTLATEEEEEAPLLPPLFYRQNRLSVTLPDPESTI
jgi:hypothetical protein